MLSVNAPPVITTQPASTTVTAGGTANLTTVVAPGAGSMAGTVTYQWQKSAVNITNGGTVSGATTASLTITGVVAGDLGNYTLNITRTLNATTTITTSANAVITVNTPPTIDVQPAAASTVVGGANITLTVIAQAPSGTLSYQWRKGTTNLTNGGRISGATANSLIITGAVIGDTGSYNVVVTRTLNASTASVTSGNAAVSVNVAPVITTQPAPTTNLAPPIAFTLNVVVAPGSGSMGGTVTYQWRRGLVNLVNSAGRIAGATSASLTVSATVVGDSGTTVGGNAYTVVITRTLNGTTSTTTSANAQVIPPISIVPGAFVFRVTGAEKPYTFQLPAGATQTEQVTMSISDIWGRTIWTKSIFPARDEKARELVWNGRTHNGRQASAGMYVVRIAVRNTGETTNYVRRAVTLKP
jgi:hypothetical protein